MEKDEFPNAVPYLPSLQEGTTPNPSYRPLACISGHQVVRCGISIPIAYIFFFMAIFASDPGTLQSEKASETLMLASFLSLLWGVVGNWCFLVLAIASLFVAMWVNDSTSSVSLILWDIYYFGVLSAATCLVAVRFGLLDRIRDCWSARRAEPTATPNNDDNEEETPYTQELMTWRRQVGADTSNRDHR